MVLSLALSIFIQIGLAANSDLPQYFEEAEWRNQRESFKIPPGSACEKSFLKDKQGLTVARHCESSSDDYVTKLALWKCMRKCNPCKPKKIDCSIVQLDAKLLKDVRLHCICENTQSSCSLAQMQVKWSDTQQTFQQECTATSGPTPTSLGSAWQSEYFKSQEWKNIEENYGIDQLSEKCQSDMDHPEFGGNFCADSTIKGVTVTRWHCSKLCKSDCQEYSRVQCTDTSLPTADRSDPEKISIECTCLNTAGDICQQKSKASWKHIEQQFQQKCHSEEIRCQNMKGEFYHGSCFVSHLEKLSQEDAQGVCNCISLQHKEDYEYVQLAFVRDSKNAKMLRKLIKGKCHWLGLKAGGEAKQWNWLVHTEYVPFFEQDATEEQTDSAETEKKSSETRKDSTDQKKDDTNCQHLPFRDPTMCDKSKHVGECGCMSKTALMNPTLKPKKCTEKHSFFCEYRFKTAGTEMFTEVQELKDKESKTAGVPTFKTPATATTIDACKTSCSANKLCLSYSFAPTPTNKCTLFGWYAQMVVDENAMTVTGGKTYFNRIRFTEPTD